MTSNYRPWENRGKGSQNRRLTAEKPYPDLPLGQLCTTIHIAELKNLGEEVMVPARIINSQYLTSYNWLNRATHTILVPGKYLTHSFPLTP